MFALLLAGLIFGGVYYVAYLWHKGKIDLSWLQIRCPKCGSPMERVAETHYPGSGRRVCRYRCSNCGYSSNIK